LISAEKIATYEICPRRYLWTGKYRTRVSPIRALYMALDAGLRTEKDPERAAENELLALAASPGLDVVGHDVYAVAMHHAKLSGVLASALRSAWSAPWKTVEPVTLSGGHEWQSGAYKTADGAIRRLALVDRWSDDRRMQEIAGWRTMGEACALDQTLLVTAVTIGSSHDKRRHSAWTRCYRHPRNRTYRFQRKTSTEDFGSTWVPVWREDSGISTADWLTQMRADGCMTDLVHTVQVPVPKGREAYLNEMNRIAGDMGKVPEVPPMRLAGCYGFAPCPFLGVCPDTKPDKYGFRAID
jgi:hypothetical protein